MARTRPRKEAHVDFLDIFRESEDLVPFEAGSQILREGEEGDRMYVLIDGAADISLKGEVLGQAGPGEIIGEMALVSPGKRSATITATTHCKVAVIDHKAFKLIVKHVPDFSVHVVKVLAGRIREAYDDIEAR